MATLLSKSEFAKWVRKPIDIVAADEFATLVLQTATEIVCDAAKQPNWEFQTPPVVVPRQAKRICMFLAGRTYLNPDGEIDSHVGPLGARIPEAMALAAGAMQLLEAEQDALQDLRPSGGNGLWIQPVKREETVADVPVLLADADGLDHDLIGYGVTDDTVAFTPEEP